MSAVRNFNDLQKDHYYLTVMDIPARCVATDLASSEYTAVCLMFERQGETVHCYQRDGKEFTLPFPSELDIVCEIDAENYFSMCNEILGGHSSWENSSDMQPGFSCAPEEGTF